MSEVATDVEDGCQVVDGDGPDVFSCFVYAACHAQANGHGYKKLLTCRVRRSSLRRWPFDKTSDNGGQPRELLVLSGLSHWPRESPGFMTERSNDTTRKKVPGWMLFPAIPNPGPSYYFTSNY